MSKCTHAEYNHRCPSCTVETYFWIINFSSFTRTLNLFGNFLLDVDAQIKNTKLPIIWKKSSDALPECSFIFTKETLTVSCSCRQLQKTFHKASYFYWKQKTNHRGLWCMKKYQHKILAKIFGILWIIMSTLFTVWYI